ncbi:hypothetical protein K438DRAFT_1749740 [Mycena galopus ATCC 62051]|nr:hypothetical protein K438DRAFT_1749740 [Mycena galopus ATCC 62051]
MYITVITSYRALEFKAYARFDVSIRLICTVQQIFQIFRRGLEQEDLVVCGLLHACFRITSEGSIDLNQIPVRFRAGRSDAPAPNRNGSLGWNLDWKDLDDTGLTAATHKLLATANELHMYRSAVGGSEANVGDLDAGDRDGDSEGQVDAEVAAYWRRSRRTCGRAR